MTPPRTRPRLRTLRVEVTADDIRNGDHDVSWCPIALALRRLGVERPRVDEEEITGFFGPTRRPFAVTLLDLPREVGQFLDAFDHPRRCVDYDTDEYVDVAATPIAFDLDVVEDVT